MTIQRELLLSADGVLLSSAEVGRLCDSKNLAVTLKQQTHGCGRAARQQKSKNCLTGKTRAGRGRSLVLLSAGLVQTEPGAG